MRADVLVVDDTGGAGSSFTDLPAAVAAAADGDILLVRDGTYSGFTLGKALTITAESGARIRMAGPIVVQGLPVGSTATLTGFQPAVTGMTQGGQPIYGDARLELQTNAGAVFVRDGMFRSLDPLVPAVSADAGNVLTLVDCTVPGTPDATVVGTTVHIENSEVFLHRFSVSGSRGKNAPKLQPGGVAGGPGGVGLSISESRIYMDMGDIRGGRGGNGSEVACGDGGPGGTAIVMSGGSSRLVRRSSVVAEGAGGLGGGAPPAGATCPDGSPGLAFDVQSGEVTSIGGSHRGLTLTSPVREGEPLGLYLIAPAGDQAYLLLSFATAPLYLPGTTQLLTVASPIRVFFLGEMPAASSTVTIAPYVPAVLDGFAVHAQVIFIAGGGQLHGSNGHEIVLLSNTF